MGRGGIEVRIDVGSGPRVLDCVIRECLVEIYSIATLFTPCERVNKILNFSDPILRSSLIFSISSSGSMLESITQDFSSRWPPNPTNFSLRLGFGNAGQDDWLTVGEFSN